MELSLEQQLLNQSPFAVLFTSMVLMGSFINHNATDNKVTPSETWCKNTTSIEELIAPMPKDLE